MSTPEEKKEKKALYNKNHREKQRQLKLLKEKNEEQEEKKEIQAEEKKEIVEEKNYEQEILEEVQETSDKVIMSREDYEFLIEQATKQNKTEPIEQTIIKTEVKKEDTFFFRLQNSIKNQMISSIASMGSVLALSLAIRGSQSLMNSMNKSSVKSLTSTKLSESVPKSDETYCPRVVNFA